MRSTLLLQASFDRKAEIYYLKLTEVCQNGNKGALTCCRSMTPLLPNLERVVAIATSPNRTPGSTLTVFMFQKFCPLCMDFSLLSYVFKALFVSGCIRAESSSRRQAFWPRRLLYKRHVSSFPDLPSFPNHYSTILQPFLHRSSSRKHHGNSQGSSQRNHLHNHLRSRSTLIP